MERGTGITPACAGKRDKAGLPFVPVRDHPRVCGEKSGRVRPWRKHKGSPPRVRGKGVRSTCIPALTRITPACAGKRRNAIPRAAFFRDHPRVCGEKTHQPAFQVHLLGSPPRVRGKEMEEKDVKLYGGITPACAGKSKTRRVQWPAGLDHPRVCGEKRPDRQLTGWPLGSPPRMRGKVLYRSGPDAGGRITPAYAGKSYTRTCYAYNVRDHPRVCGEKVGMGYRGKAPVGSPPRMRGKVYAHRSARVRCGITPAYAGKSSYTSDRAAVSRDHPRVCGEKYLPDTL